MKYKIKVGEKYLIGENPKETLKGTVAGDTTAVFSRVVKEMSAYDFCDNIEDADAKDCLTACDYIRGLMDRQNYGFYLGEIKLIDADAEETVVHCNREENAKIIAHILEFDSQNMVYDWYEQHIANTAKYYEEKLNSPENPDSSAVNVVRCKDCRYFYDGYDEKCCINHRGVVVTDENGFCHHAERKGTLMATKEELFAAVRLIIKNCKEQLIHDCDECALYDYCCMSFFGRAPGFWPDPEEGGGEDD